MKRLAATGKLKKILASAAVFSVAAIGLSGSSPATAATNNYINFQARLLNASGSVVLDGNYNVEFKIYDTNISSGSSQGSCSGDAHCLWVETRTSGNQVRVAGGYLSVQLGSVNALPTNINWDQQLYLTMNIGGTGSPSWDGEMLNSGNRLPLTGVPYAFRSGSTFNVINSSGTTLLSTSGSNVTIPNATGSSSALQFGGDANADLYKYTTGTLKTDGSFLVGGSLGIGTNSLQAGAAITMTNGSWLSSIDAAGTGFINLFSVNSSNQIQAGAAIAVDGGIVLPTNAGQVTLSDLPIDSSASAGTKESYTLRVGSANALTVYGEADGSGNAQNIRVAIGSSITPSYTLDVGGDVNIGGSNAYRVGGVAICTSSGCAPSSGSASYVQLQGSTPGTAQTGNFNVSGTGIASTILAGYNSITGGVAAFNGNVGIGTSSPARKLDIVDSTNPQLRLTYTAGSVYTDLQTNSSGFLNINTTGSRVSLGNGCSASTALTVCGDISVGAGNVIRSTSGNLVLRSANTTYATLNAGTTTLDVAVILNAQATGKTAIQIADSGAQNSGITIGGDTNLYRSAANTLTTDDTFNSALGIQTNGTTRIDSSGNLTNIGNITSASGILSLDGIKEARGNFSTGAVANSWYTLATATVSNTFGVSDLTGYVIIQNDDQNYTRCEVTVSVRSVGTLNTDAPLVRWGDSCRGTFSGLFNSGTYNPIQVIKVSDTNGGNKVYELQVTTTDGSWNTYNWDFQYDTQSSSIAYVVNTTAATANTAVSSPNTVYGGDLDAFGNSIFQSSVNSTTAFQVQNANAAPIFVVDTTSTDGSGAQVNYLAYAGFEAGSFSNASAGWAPVSPATLSQNTSKQQTYNGLFSAQVATTSSNGGLSTNSFTVTPTTGTYIISWYAKVSSGTMASTAFTVQTTDGTTHSCSPAAGVTINSNGFQRLYCSITTTGTITALQITQNDSTARTIYIDAVQLQKNSINGSSISAPSAYQDGAIQLRGTITNPITLQNNADSTAAFQVQSANSNTVLVVDTLNGRVAVGSSALPANGVLTIGTNTTAASGGIYFGTDTNLYRSASGTIKTDGTLVANTALGVGIAPSGGQLLQVQGANSAGYAAYIENTDTGSNSSGLSVRVDQNGGTNILLNVQTGASGTAFQITGDKKVKVGTSSTGVLQLLNDGGTNSTGIQFGSAQDTNLYRSASSTLKTDGAFQAAGGNSILNASGDITLRSSTTAQVFVGNIGGGVAGIQLGNANAANLYQGAASTLKTDGNLDINGSITGSTQANTKYIGTGRNVTPWDQTFENNITGWSAVNNTSFTQSATAAYEGTKSFKIQRNDLTGAGGAQYTIGTSLKAGQVYSLSGYYEMSGGSSTTQIKLNSNAANSFTNGTTFTDKTLSNVSTWTYFSMSVTASTITTGNNYIWLANNIADTSTIVYLDDLVLSEGSLPLSSYGGLKSTAAGTADFFNANLGVGGNNNPQYALDATGDINASGNIRTGGSIRIDTSGNYTGGTINTDTLDSTHLTFSGAATATVSAASAQNLALQSGDTSHFVVLQGSGGNVGIGSSSPGSKLTVSGGDINLDNGTFVGWGGGTGRPAITGDKSVGTLTFYTSGSAHAVIDTSGNLTFQQATTVSTSTGNLTVQANGTSTLLLDTSGAGTVSIGQTATTVNVASTSTATAITIGNTTGGTALTLQSGTGNITLQTAASSSINIGANNVASKTINIGSVGSTAQATTVHIADTTGSAAQTVTIGSTASSSALTLQGGTNGVTIQAAASSSINIGTNNVASKTINIGSVGSTAQATTVHIADTSGNSAQTVTIGSTGNTGSTTTLQAGQTKESITTNGVAVQTTTNSTTAFQVQDASSNTLFNVDSINQQISIGITGTSPISATLPGISGSYASTPDSVANSVTGDIDLIAKIAPTDWTPAASQMIIGKDSSGSSQVSYEFFIASGGSLGRFTLGLSNNGTAFTTATSSVAPSFVNGSANWVRATWVASTGTVQFFTSSDGSTWTQLGTNQSISNVTVPSIFDSTAAVRVGTISTSNTSPFSGNIYRAQIWNGISTSGGTLAADFNPADAASGAATSWAASTTGETWTLNGNAKLAENTAILFTPSLATFNTAALFEATSNSTTAFQVQNSSGTTVLDVDTTNGNVGIGTTSPLEKLSVNGNIRVGSGTSSDLIIKPGVTPAVTVGGSTSATVFTTAGTGAGAFHLGFEIPANDANDGFYIATDANTDGTVDTLALKINAAGNMGLSTTNPQSTLSVSGGVAIGTTYAGTNAAASNNLIVQGNVGIGATSPSAKLQVAGGQVLIDNAKFYQGLTSGGSAQSLIGISTGDATLLRATSSGYKFQNSSLASVISIDDSGGLVISPSAAGSHTFQVQDSSSNSMLNVNSSSNLVTVGASSTTPTLLVLGIKTTSGDPTCTTGAIYYNSNDNQFRGCNNGTWYNVITAIDIQVYTGGGSYTWTKPSGAQLLEVIAVGAGGGGGSGRCDAASTAREGGGGGGGGAYSAMSLAASLTTSTVTVTVGAGGGGGAAVACGGTNGNGGTGGGASHFGTYLGASGGSGGARGTNSDGSGTGGAGGLGLQTGGVGGDTFCDTSTCGGTNGETTGLSAAGGGAGGTKNSVNSNKGGTSGGSARTGSGATLTGGSTGNPGGNGGSSPIVWGIGGAGGGGGQASTQGSGGNGGSYGGGGGGGSGTSTGGTGAGGSGADGIVIVITF